ncbi:hypothetical protein ACIQ1J_05525 [Streptomyces sp. NPDC097107]|uniref:hypothetical protein n=1 Tax=Streptomyces sp. NPDC097107 TaxID=3366089 RepID=UPI003822D81D
MHNRTAWFSVTGMADLFDRRLHLTDSGRDVLARLALGTPEYADTRVTTRLTAATGAVADLIASLNGAELRARADGANLYIPGTSANGGSLEALHMLTEAAIPSIRDTDFFRLVQANFPKADREGRGIGLWHRNVLAASCTEPPLVEVEVRSGDPTERPPPCGRC